jgi:hypothetical protein
MTTESDKRGDNTMICLYLPLNLTAKNQYDCNPILDVYHRTEEKHYRDLDKAEMHSVSEPAKVFNKESK